MKIIHLSDTHIGFNELDKITREGVNVREQDFYDAFEKTINRIIEIKPSAVIHTGDFFHRPSPANRPMIFGLSQLKRLEKEKIPFYVISGNHETPRTAYSSPILQAFSTLDNVFPIYGRNYEKHETGDLIIHGVPHINDESVYSDELKKVKIIPGRVNILMLHTTVGKDYIMDEYGEKVLPGEMYESLKEFNYTALGHWHNFQQIKKAGNAWYSGSTERLSEKEADKEKGFIIADFSDKGDVKINFEIIPARTWKRIDIDSCADKTIENLKKEIISAADTFKIDGAIITINLYNIKPEQSIEISNKALADFFPDALTVIPRRFLFSDKDKLSSKISTHETMDELFDSYLKNKCENDAEYIQMKEISSKYFSTLNRGME